MTTLFSYLRLLLLPFSYGYYGLLCLRHFCYNKGIFPSFTAAFPVISVGNIHSGGTGKTPLIDYLVQYIGGDRCTVIARGYKRKNKSPMLVFEPKLHQAQDIGDELSLLHSRHENLSVIAAYKRKDALNYMIRYYETNPKNTLPIALLDDGLQHLSVSASLHIALYPYTRTLSDYFLLPAGNLRDIPRALRKAAMLIISKCPPALSYEKAAQLKENLTQTLRLSPHQEIFFTYLNYALPRAVFGKEYLPQLPTHILLIEGIARPNPLLDYLAEKKINIIKHLSFPDHHHYLAPDIHKINRIYTSLKQKYPSLILLTTEKDAVKLRNFASLKPLPIYALPIHIRFLFNQETLFQTHINKHLHSFTRQ